LKTKKNNRPADRRDVSDPEHSAKIKAIKEQIEQGIYKIDPEKVAQAMINDLIRLKVVR